MKLEVVCFVVMKVIILFVNYKENLEGTIGYKRKSILKRVDFLPETTEGLGH